LEFWAYLQNLANWCAELCADSFGACLHIVCSGEFALEAPMSAATLCDDGSPARRVYGYIDDYGPHKPTLVLFDHVNAILTEYLRQLPLSLRQIYYRLVAAYGYPKTKNFYDKLSALLTKARRARWESTQGRLWFDCIRDDTFNRQVPFYYVDERDFWGYAKLRAMDFRLDRMENQERRIVLWCEAAGMFPQFVRLANPYGIGVYCSGGFDRVTSKRQLGIEWAKRKQPITVIHVGDHDPSGIHIFEAVAMDIIAFAKATALAEGYAEPDVEFVRLAITPQQAALHDIPDNGEPKITDRRSFERFALRCSSDAGAEYVDCDPTITWQAEALPPDLLSQMISEAIATRIDAQAFAEIKGREAELRKSITQKMERLERLPPPLRRPT
jgi:hypothetical protein